MEPKKTDVIGGFNRFLTEQQAQPGECRLTLVKFNTARTVVHSALPITSVQPFTDKTYVPGGMTALLDAVAEAVRLADKDKRDGERVLCLVVTDGEENSSRETSREQAHQLITEREGRGAWTFTYLGIAPDQWHEQGLTISRANAAAYDPNDPARSIAQMSAGVTAYRASVARQSASFYQPPGAPPPQEHNPKHDPKGNPWAKPHQAKRP